MLDDEADAPLAAADVGHVDLHCDARPLPPCFRYVARPRVRQSGAFKSVADKKMNGMGLESSEIWGDLR